MTKKPKSQLTPGPWRVEKEKSPGFKPKTFQVFGGPRNNDKKMFIADCGLHNYSKANARLIAVAPKLLKEAKAIARYLHFKLDITAKMANDLNAAIAKAEGGNSHENQSRKEA